MPSKILLVGEPMGLFIAKTLLERSGADVSFANGSDPFLTTAERPARCGAGGDSGRRRLFSAENPLGATWP